MGETEAAEYTPIHLYSMENGRTSKHHHHKGWTIFTHPHTQEWGSAYGPLDAPDTRDSDGRVGRLSITKLKRGSAESAAYIAINKKRERGYKYRLSFYGHYVNVNTGEIVDADGMSANNRKVLRQNAITPVLDPPGQDRIYHGHTRPEENIEFAKKAEENRQAERNRQAEIERQEERDRQAEQDRITKEKANRLKGLSVQNWF